jgi:DNA helicase-2/ATP-dependent DNA helicase PcrA
MTVKIGQTVEHERFGIGKVLNMEGEDESIKVTILFKNVGNKQLLLRFAKLKVVE